MQALYQEAFTESLKKAGLVYHPMCMISCSSEFTAGFLILVLLQVFSKRKGKGADGEDRSAGTTEEFAAAAASEKKEVMLQWLGPLVGWSYTKSPCFPVF